MSLGVCQMTRRRALEQVGLYDPAIFYGPEDVDLCLRMWLVGWKVLYDGRRLNALSRSGCTDPIQPPAGSLERISAERMSRLYQDVYYRVISGTRAAALQ